MNRRTAAATVLLLATLLGACGGTSKPDPAACEAAMRTQLQSAMSDPSAPAATKPAACNGLTDKQLEEIGTRVLGDEVGKTPTP